MYQHTDDLTILFDAFEVFYGGGFGASGGSSVFGEGLLGGFVPVLAESAFDFVREMGCPDGSERAESTGSFNVTDNTTHNQWRSLDIRLSIP
jgi:hypothetical protein